MPVALYAVRVPDVAGVRLARGEAGAGPDELLAPTATATVLFDRGGAAAAIASVPGDGPLPDGWRPAPVVAGSEVWAAGVTYLRSRTARMEESEAAADVYDLVYDAERPELFWKAQPGDVRGPGEPVGIRADSTWDVPEPELALVVAPDGRVAGYTIGNDMSSRSIEGDNPLYLPQAKVYDGSCALGPCIVPADAVEPPFEITLTIERAGATVFEGTTSTAQMKRSFEDLAGHLVRARTFATGVTLLTGTGIVPPSDFTLAAGDVVHVDIDGIGRLTNPVEVVGRPA